MAEDVVHNGAALPSGTRLHGRFEIEECIGSGGFGIVYNARDLHASGEHVAIKEFFPIQFGAIRAGSRVAASDRVARTAIVTGCAAFQREAKLLRKLNHPNIVRVHDWFEENDTVYMVMQKLDGETLQQVLKRGRPIDGSRTESWLAALLDALVVIHREKIVHGDISPCNIIITEDNRPVLIDFGAARQSVAQVSLSLAGVVNAGYTPIEGYGEGGAEAMIPATDLYALGASFYEVTTGKRPLAAPNRIPVDRLRRASELAKDNYPAYLLHSIDHAMWVNSDERWSSARAWLDAIRAREMPPLKAYDPEPSLDEAKRPWPLIFVSALALLAVGGAIYQAIQLDDARAVLASTAEARAQTEKDMASLNEKLRLLEKQAGEAVSRGDTLDTELEEVKAAAPKPNPFFRPVDVNFDECIEKTASAMTAAGLNNVRAPSLGWTYADGPGCTYIGVCTGLPEGNVHQAVVVFGACNAAHSAPDRWEALREALLKQFQ